MAKFIWQLKGWPKFVWDAQAVASVLSDVVFKEGEFLGRLGALGFENKACAGRYLKRKTARSPYAPYATSKAISFS